MGGSRTSKHLEVYFVLCIATGAPHNSSPKTSNATHVFTRKAFERQQSKRDCLPAARPPPCPQVLKEATASFKKGDMAAMAYHENVLKKAFGKRLPDRLPEILKALPPDRAAALKAVVEVTCVACMWRVRSVYPQVTSG